MAMNLAICTSKFLCGDGGWRNPRTGDVIGEVKVHFRRFHRRTVWVRGCSSSCDGLSGKDNKIAKKVRAIIPNNHPQVVLQQRDHVVEHSQVEHGKNVPCENVGCDIPWKRQVSDKLMVAVDVDEDFWRSATHWSIRSKNIMYMSSARYGTVLPRKPIIVCMSSLRHPISI